MQKRCILCADPDPELRSNLGFLLAGENCVLEEAAGGATLLTQLRRSTEQTGSRDIEGRRCYSRGSRHDTVKTFGRLCFPLY